MRPEMLPLEVWTLAGESLVFRDCRVDEMD
jgi:hypothetical protein